MLRDLPMRFESVDDYNTYVQNHVPPGGGGSLDWSEWDVCARLGLAYDITYTSGGELVTIHREGGQLVIVWRWDSGEIYRQVYDFVRDYQLAAAMPWRGELLGKADLRSMVDDRGCQDRDGECRQCLSCLLVGLQWEAQLGWSRALVLHAPWCSGDYFSHGTDPLDLSYGHV
ncbi:MAG: hypothetical protein NTY30_00600, partial [Candidatus Berkelbacteria bacterium]|nr:hypothetical protein [Candidatus Berkelbacteria bacterium]